MLRLNSLFRAWRWEDQLERHYDVAVPFFIDDDAGWGAFENFKLGAMGDVFFRAHGKYDDLSARPLTGDFS